MLSAALAVWCVGWPAASAAQQAPPSLVELARQEQARRKTVKVASKVYSDKDQRVDAPAAPRGQGGVAASIPDATVVPDAPRPTEAAPVAAEAGDHDEAWWKGRMNQAREELRRNAAFAEALQSQVNALTGDYVNRDDPYQRSKIGEDRQRAIAELDRVKQSAEQAKKAITAIEEEARQASVPPGWIR
ncbi:MAG: hypothetical protein ABJC89_19920 [Acidobacteriota bacterium]